MRKIMITLLLFCIGNVNVIGQGKYDVESVSEWYNIKDNIDFLDTNSGIEVSLFDRNLKVIPIDTVGQSYYYFGQSIDFTASYYPEEETELNDFQLGNFNGNYITAYSYEYSYQRPINLDSNVKDSLVIRFIEVVDSIEVPGVDTFASIELKSGQIEKELFKVVKELDENQQTDNKFIKDTINFSELFLSPQKKLAIVMEFRSGINVDSNLNINNHSSFKTLAYKWTKQVRNNRGVVRRYNYYNDVSIERDDIQCHALFYGGDSVEIISHNSSIVKDERLMHDIKIHGYGVGVQYIFSSHQESYPCDYETLYILKTTFSKSKIDSIKWLENGYYYGNIINISDSADLVDVYHYDQKMINHFSIGLEVFIDTIVYSYKGLEFYEYCESIEEFSSNFSIYPNPSTGMFTLQKEGFNGRIFYTVINQQGQVVLNDQMQSNETMKRIDLLNESKGVYQVLITDGEKVERKQIVVQ